MMESVLPALYLLAAAGFILAIKWMSSPATARRGVIAGEIGMLLAVVGTLLRSEVVDYQWILIAFFLGSAIGVPLAYLMPMTAVPQRTALSHAFGALASALIGTAEFYRHSPTGFTMGVGNSVRLSYFHSQFDGIWQAAGIAPHAAHHL
jgi:NAD(P) transhydrogenase subunit beta